MFARVTTYKADPQKLEEMAAEIEGLKPQIKSIPGVVDIFSAWQSNGDGMSMAIYESQTAAEASASQVKAIWAGLSEYLIAAPEISTYENVKHLTG